MEPINLSLGCSFTTAVEPTQRVCEVASMFGLGVDRSRTIAVVPPMTLPVADGSVVFITSASGGGKSTLLRLIGEQLRTRDDVRVVEFGRSGRHRQAASDERAIVEAIGGTLEQATRWLALAGLNDAFVMLRKIGELSDGQRYRFALAQAIAEAEQGEHAGALTVVLADEFGSTLDRLTAKVVARNVRKWATRSAACCSALSSQPEGGLASSVCFIAATTHDDLLEYLDPDVLVVQEPGEGAAVHCRERRAG